MIISSLNEPKSLLNRDLELAEGQMSKVTLDNGVVVNVFDGIPGASFPFAIDGVEFTHGRLDSGNYSGQFGKATRLESLWVTSGSGTINGQRFMRGDLVLIQKGAPIDIVVDPDMVLTYLCAYEVLGALVQTTGKLLLISMADKANMIFTATNGGVKKIGGRWILDVGRGIPVDAIKCVELA